jgi:hypothetical protein
VSAPAEARSAHAPQDAAQRTLTMPRFTLRSGRAAGLFLVGLLGVLLDVEACWLDDISLGGAGGAPFATTTSGTVTGPSTTTSVSVTTSISGTSTGTGGEGGMMLVELCGDGRDNDGDTQVDCEDIDCAAVCQDSCIAPAVVAGSTSVRGDSTGAPSVQAASCTADSGPEVFYEVVAPFDGFLEALLDSDPDLGISVRTSCPDDASEIACEERRDARFTESLVTAVRGGETYFVMVDANRPGEAGRFSLSIDFRTFRGESICDDLNDDDGDGLTDCEDPFYCRTYDLCIPGVEPVGAGCFEASECAAGGAASAPVCISEARFGFPRGHCSEFCDLSVDDCGTGAVCVDQGLVSGSGLCFRACATGADCPPDYACADGGAADRICVAAEQCDDLADNDGDGAVDCADAGCSGYLPCVCEDAVPIGLGTTAGDTTGDTTGGTLAFRGSCTPRGDAPEDLYTFTPAAAGTLRITLTSATDQGIYVFGDCVEPSSELACENLLPAGGTATLGVAVSAGTPVFIVVDGYSGPADAGPYALTLALE